MSASVLRERVRSDLLRHIHRGDASVEELSRTAMRLVARAVPFDGMCVLTMDPATLLPTGDFVENALPPDTMLRLTEIELQEPDFNKFTALAHAPRSAASLSEATEGELDQSIRQRELRRPNGFGDELRAVLSDDTGTWGAFTLSRATDRPGFTPSEVRFVSSLTQLLADGVRKAALLGELSGEAEVTTGLLVLAPDDTVEMANRVADHWLDELDTGRHSSSLPTAVRSVAARARRLGDGDLERDDDPPGGIARARVRTGAGRWVVVHGSILGAPDAAGEGPRVAILLEAAGRPELAPLIAATYGFTERERRVTELVAQGFTTNEIAERLHLSAYTIQDHLKSIFRKSDTSSRGDLVARLFFEHHAPRLSAEAPRDA